MSSVNGDIRSSIFDLQTVIERLSVHLEDHDEMTLYSQRDSRWRHLEYAGGATFGRSGCYVTCVAMIASVAGYTDDPRQVAAKLGRAQCFSGAYLSRPDNIPEAYPRLRWDGLLDWRHKPADMDRLRNELGDGPVIVEVEFRPGGVQPPHDQHFVVVERFASDNRDLWIVDPWDGSATKLLERYAMEHWDLPRAVYGARLLKVK